MFELRHGARAKQRCRDARLILYPQQCQLHGRHADVVRQVDKVGAGLNPPRRDALGIDPAAQCRTRISREVCRVLVAARQQPRRDRRPGNQPDPVLETQRHQLIFDPPVEQVVRRLLRDKVRPAMQFGDVQRLHDLPGGMCRRADIEHLAVAHQRVQRIERFLDRDLRRGAVQLVNIDMVGLQPSQRIFAGLNNVAARVAAVVGPWPGRIEDLGRQHKAVPPCAAAPIALQPPANKAFALAGKPLAAVTVGCIDQVDAGGRSPIEQGVRRSFVDWIGKIVGAETDRC